MPNRSILLGIIPDAAAMRTHVMSRVNVCGSEHFMVQIVPLIPFDVVPGKHVFLAAVRTRNEELALVRLFVGLFNS